MSVNQTGITKKSYASENQILFSVEHQVSVGIVVSQEVGQAVGTRKIAKAGTPLTGNLDARLTPFTEANTNGADVVGVLLHDVDVTAGDGNGTLLIFGFVNTERIDSTTRAKLNSNVKKTLESKMIKCIAEK